MKKRNILLMLLVLVIMASCWGLKTEAATSFIYDKDYNIKEIQEPIPMATYIVK